MELENLLNIINNTSGEDNKEIEKNYFQHNQQINQKLYPNYFMEKNNYKTVNQNKENILSQKQTLKDNIKPKIICSDDSKNTQNQSSPSQENIHMSNNNMFSNFFAGNDNNNLTKLLPLFLAMKNGMNPTNLMSIMGINNPVLIEMLKNNQFTTNNKKDVVQTNYIDSDPNPKISSYKRIF